MFSEAYFSKYTDWSYEQEIRFVDESDFTENIDGNRILFIPSSCVTSIILGSKSPSEKVKLGIEKADACDLAWYKLEIGKSYPVPYMSNHSDDMFIFKEAEILIAEDVCTSCSEPISEGIDLCPWCSITEAHKLEAAQGNPFRIMDHYGTLEKYIKEMSKVGS